MWELNPIWATLREDERAMLSERVEVVRYAKNEIIHNDGDESEYVWMLLSGKVTNPKWDRACEIADALGVTLQDFRELMEG